MKRVIKGFSILFFLGFVLSVNAQTIEAIESRRQNYQNLRQNRYALLPHRPTYLLPFTYNWMTHESLYEKAKEIDSEGEGDFYKNTEAEFQVSFSIPIVKDIGDRKWDFMFAYTHRAWWQVYNSSWSRPFRETNYMPEFFSRYIYSEPKSFLGINLEALDTGYIHQSNGQTHGLSRSWDRLFARVLLRKGSLSTVVSLWYRLKEEKDDDDNPDIYNYMGIGEVELVKTYKKNAFHLKVPLLAHHPSWDVRYSYPLTEGVRWYLTYQAGYGHSMIEYNEQVQRIGLGFTLENFLYD